MQETKFVRYGTLNPIKQEKYGKEGFHYPPCKYGIYAFRKDSVDKYLLGATYHPSNKSSKSEWLKDDNGELFSYKRFYSKSFDEKLTKEASDLLKKKNIKIRDIYYAPFNEELDEYEKTPFEDRNFMIVLKNRKEFNHKGNIWHHLGEFVKNKKEIIKTVNSWVLTDMETYHKAYKKYTLHYKSESVNYLKDFCGNPTTCRNIYSKTDLEVFIEKIKTQ